MLYRELIIVAACFSAAVIAFAEDKCANDAKELQGTWQGVYLEANGEKKPDDEIKDLQIIITEDDLAVKPDGEGRKCKFTLDAAKTPKAIDLVPSDGGGKGKTFAGIYSVQDGKLRLCINIFGKDISQRPKEFKTQAGDGLGFAILERVKQ